MRRNLSSDSRRHLLIAIALILLATGPLGLLALQASVRQQRLARALLTAEAMVMAQRYSNRAMIDLYNGATAIMHPLNAGRFGRGDAALSTPQLMYVAADSAEQCKCAAVFRPAYVFRLEISTRRIDGDAADSAWLREMVPRRFSELLGGWDVALLGHLDPHGRLVFIAPYRSRSRDIVYGFGVDTAIIATWVFRPRMSSMERLARAPELSNSSALALRVADEGGRTVFRTTAETDTSIASQVRLGDIWGGLTIAVSLQPDAASRVLSGALPSSPVPLLITLLVVAGLLVSAALVLLWRAVDLARLRGEFTSSVSHELRTPLTQILLYAETLEMEREESPEERKRALRVMTRESRRLIHLVENVLRLSRAERGVVEVDMRPQLIAPLLAETVAAFEPIARARSTTVKLNVAAPVTANVDGDALRRVVLNFLDNAVRHGPEGQTVVVSAEQRSNVVRVSVDDEGPGVPLPDRERIWNPFVRLRRGLGGDSGSGIGLAVVSDLVEAHGGRRGVEKAPSGGARFFAEFRAVPA